MSHKDPICLLRLNFCFISRIILHEADTNFIGKQTVSSSWGIFSSLRWRHVLHCHPYLLPFHIVQQKYNYLFWLISCYYCKWLEYNLMFLSSVLKSWCQYVYKVIINWFSQPCLLLASHGPTLKHTNPISKCVKWNEEDHCHHPSRNKTCVSRLIANFFL